MESIQHLKARLALLDAMLSRMNRTQPRTQHLKRTVFVLRAMLEGNEELRSPYGPHTAIAKFSLQ
jgi:hypothetical protein